MTTLTLGNGHRPLSDRLWSGSFSAVHFRNMSRNVTCDKAIPVTSSLFNEALSATFARLSRLRHMLRRFFSRNSRTVEAVTGIARERLRPDLYRVHP